jgi:hypothetical protein
MSIFSKNEAVELVKLFRTELGLEVSEEEACQHAAQLVDLLRVVYRDAQDNSPPS